MVGIRDHLSKGPLQKSSCAASVQSESPVRGDLPFGRSRSSSHSLVPASCSQIWFSFLHLAAFMQGSDSRVRCTVQGMVWTISSDVVRGIGVEVSRLGTPHKFSNHSRQPCMIYQQSYRFKLYCSSSTSDRAERNSALDRKVTKMRFKLRGELRAVTRLRHFGRVYLFTAHWMKEFLWDIDTNNDIRSNSHCGKNV